VTSDPEIPTSQRRVSSQISGMEALDDHTLIMRWKGAYPFANVITEDDLGPLPMHLMGPLYEADKERFVQSPHWAREFVGLGPFKLTEWEPGSHMVLGANEQFWDGRPKLDRIIVRFIEDDSTAVAQMLAGTVDGDIAETIQFGQAMFVNREWEAAGRKPALVVQPTKWRFLFTQFRDPKPQELLDVRARRGLLHAIDRQTLVDALVEGRTLVSDSMIPPTDPKYDWAKDSMARYSYDVTRAEQLLAEVGWRRGPERSLMDASGQRVTIPAWTQPGDTNGQELSIIADQWRSLGANVEESRLTTAQVRDTKYLVSFPGFVAAQIPLSFNNLMSRVNGAQCPVEETRWAGSSWGCYQNAEMDAAIRGLQGSIDFTEQQRHWRDLVRIQSQEVPVLPLYFNVTATLFREGVLGVKGHTVPKTAATWNSAEWDVAS
jgi:peptide/nickel transport system substrate-binding protein